MAIPVNAVTLQELIPKVLKAKLMPMVHGSPAIGKSAIAKHIAKAFNLFLIDIRLSQYEPTDLLGFPQLDLKRQKAGYMPMDTFPLEGEEIPKGYSGWLLFFDEFNSATQSVQKAAYRVSLDREVGQRKLHDRCLCMGAGNLETDNALVETMPTPLQSRLIHLVLEADANVWTDWAHEAGIDHRITSFIDFKPSMIYNFDPDHSDLTYASPRTWEFTDKMIRGEDVSNHKLFLPLLAGTLGEGVAREFLGFCKIHTQLPKPSEIIAKPESIHVPNEPSILYALTGSLANHMDSVTAEPLMKFISRMPIEFQIVAMRGVTKRKRELLKVPAVTKWVSTNANSLY
jgi:hypothetical protein